MLIKSSAHALIMFITLSRSDFLANSILIKFNQIGSITETIETINIANQNIFSDESRKTIGVAACDVDRDGYEEIYFLTPEELEIARKNQEAIDQEEWNKIEVERQNRIAAKQERITQEIKIKKDKEALELRYKKRDKRNGVIWYVFVYLPCISCIPLLLVCLHIACIRVYTALVYTCTHVYALLVYV